MAIGVVDSVTSGNTIAESERRYLAALERVRQGTFGLCVDCERPIERPRIDCEPLVERCSSCAQRPPGNA